MSASPPPIQMAYAIENYFGPGFWSDWFGKIQQAFEEGPYYSGRWRVSSWYRSPDHNARVGGHPRSQHLYGLAFDLPIAGGDTAHEMAAALRRQGFVAIVEPDHIHVQTFPAGYLDA